MIVWKKSIFPNPNIEAIWSEEDIERAKPLAKPLAKDSFLSDPIQDQGGSCDFNINAVE